MAESTTKSHTLRVDCHIWSENIGDEGQGSLDDVQLYVNRRLARCSHPSFGWWPGSQTHGIRSDEALREPRAIVITLAYSLNILHTCNNADHLPIQVEGHWRRAHRVRRASKNGHKWPQRPVEAVQQKFYELDTSVDQLNCAWAAAVQLLRRADSAEAYLAMNKVIPDHVGAPASCYHQTWDKRHVLKGTRVVYLAWSWFEPILDKSRSVCIGQRLWETDDAANVETEWGEASGTWRRYVEMDLK